MADASSTTVQVQALLDRLRAGDASARNELLDRACERMRRLAHQMLRSSPSVHRWEQTDDLLQTAVLRLHRTLGQMTVETTQSFFRLAALHIRRTLLDLAKHYQGPQGLGANHASHPCQPDPSDSSTPAEPADLSCEPGRLAIWGEFHEQIERLPEEERETFELLWYQGLTQAEAGEVLGVSERTIKRRWLSARMHLRDALQGELPG